MGLGTGTVGKVVEVFSQGKVKFGIVREECDGGVLADVLENDLTVGKMKKVADGEIVSVWKEESKLESEGDLLNFVQEARNIIQNSPSRSLNLTPLCKEMQVLGKRRTCTSGEIGDYLFSSLMNGPRRLAARAAAAMLVGNDHIRFKRGKAGDGFYAVPQAVAEARARTEFVKLAASMRDKTPEEKKGFRWTRAHLSMMSKLEIGAASETSLNKATRTLLKELGYPETPEGAAATLVDVGYWSEERLKERVDSNVSGGGPDALDWTFPDAAVAEAKRVLEEQNNVRRGYADGSVALWRDQKRVDTDIYCVDEFSTRFYDDAVSAEILDERTTRVYVHVADVDAVVQPKGDIDRIALARGESMYLPKRPFHMIPPAAMEASSFNPVLHGLAVSVAFDVDLETGDIIDTKVFRSVLRPIIRVTYDQFNEIASDKNVDTYPKKWVDDLKVLCRATEAMMKQRSESEGSSRKDDDRRIAGVTVYGGRKKKTIVRDFKRSFGHRAVDELLSVAGEQLRKFAKKKKCALPERSGAELFALRCGTAPMRRYVDLVIQRQIKTVLVGHQMPARRRRMMELCTYLEKRHSEVQKILDSHRRSALYLSLAEQVADQKAAGVDHPLMNAKIITIRKKNTLLALLGTGLTALAPNPVDLASELNVGDQVQVKILDVKPEREEIRAEFLTGSSAAGK
ncbi:hypothetical protein NDN08_002622 [Rhodosorus marinus]|uniref:RNB domain-containing protein n=1 Tax=Rhodosorus marinus TaxID=101924 RepID=A0AAV8UUE5_9RHOD|nr:hypothetical protein NDN08_002622 [Rhodosorus marinus]